MYPYPRNLVELAGHGCKFIHWMVGLVTFKLQVALCLNGNLDTVCKCSHMIHHMFGNDERLRGCSSSRQMFDIQ